MARITVEDCLKCVDNRFELIHLAAKRVRQLRKGAEPMVPSKNTDVVVALREIAAGSVFRVEGELGQGLLIAESVEYEPRELPELAVQETLAEEEEYEEEELVEE